MTCFEFAGHILDLKQGRLRRGPVDVPLRRKSLFLLTFLVHNRGRVIGKEELLAAVWPRVIVSDDSLTQGIADIRRTLGADAKSLIRTIARRGYILDESQVRVLAPDAAETVHGLAGPSGAAAMPSRNTSLRLVRGEPEMPRARVSAQVIEIPRRPAASAVAGGFTSDIRWKDDEGGWSRHVAPYSSFIGATILAACAIVLAPFADAALTFSRACALLILLALFRAIRAAAPSGATVLAIQFAATASICLGLSIADGPMRLFANGEFAGMLLMMSIVSACLGVLAAQLLRAQPRYRLPLGAANLALGAGVALAFWLAGDASTDRGCAIALLSLALLQIPGAVCGSTPLFVRRQRGCGYGEPARVSVGFITPGCSFVMDAHPGHLIP